MLLGVCYTRREKTETFKEETMTNYEMVEMLREKANVSYEEAKRALGIQLGPSGRDCPA